jgi:hypothetical protein
VKFNSIKILRKHIEAMPIFDFDKNVNIKIEGLVNELIKPNQNKSESIMKEIDQLIYKEIGLSEKEIVEIKKLVYESKS